jgi:DoxX-like family
MKKTSLIFWIITGLFSAFMLFSAASELINGHEAKEFIEKLGYPAYFNPFIGIMKVFGIVALIVPGYPRIKEWAYAGFFFDLIGATYSLTAVGGFSTGILFMLLPITFLFISYIYSHKRTTERNVA